MTLKNKLRSYVKRLQSYSARRLIIEGTLLTLFIKLGVLFLVYTLFLLVFPETQLREFLPQEEAWDLTSKIIWILIVSIAIPPFETLAGQYLPIWVASKFTSKPVLMILPSAALFGILHGNPMHVFSAFLIGIVLATIFYQQKQFSLMRAFLITTAIHALHNAVTSSFTLFVFNASG